MLVRFWGTRGSLPKPGPTTVRYGGNTSCVEVRSDAGTLLVLDSGTGAHELGQAVVRDAGWNRRGNMLLTHTHWDHIQGFPFFGPVFVPDSSWAIYGPGEAGQTLRDTLAGQMHYRYFPVSLKGLSAGLRFHDIGEGAFSLGDVRVTAAYMNHTQVATGYRIVADGVTVVYATDHEPHANHAPWNDLGAWPTLAHAEDVRHAQFLAGADLVIHDAQYTDEEYPAKRGWGHSPAEYVVDLAVLGGVKQLALFHHDPLRDDASLEQVVERCQQRVAALGSDLQVLAAAEGVTLRLPDLMAPARPLLTQPHAARGTPRSEQTVLIVGEDNDANRLLEETLRDDGFRLLVVRDAEAALAAAREHRPALMLVTWHPGESAALAVCRALRAADDPGLRSLPVLLLTPDASPESVTEGFAAGANDVIYQPFAPPHVRTRVRQWLRRAQTANRT